MVNAMLMSSSKKDNLGYLEHASSQLKTLLGSGLRDVLYIPYAAITPTYDEYESLAAEPFSRLGYTIRSIHHEPDPLRAVSEAGAIAVAGGNTFALLDRLYHGGLVDPIRRRVVDEGIPYVGWSAGTNVATPSIRTSNDMPIVQPASFEGLGLVPFQINPHFVSGKPAGHNGESREERLTEFVTLNSNEEVLALYEGCALHVQGDTGTILGEREGIVFSHNCQPRTIAAGKTFGLSEIKGKK
ncbi:dipeptidase PepE [Kocuria sp. HSID16901]|uniref:dipeptidase PepE n=1 Tax=Kocuria sp. HSID16901 TaxID=2419505 RepID=UPI0006613F14|nr:dipeptidase PepE [Kocuria sp. HSID16901]RUQ21716.1 dipeptidase PepE [Kocuria sp. HSID16901]